MHVAFSMCVWKVHAHNIHTYTLYVLGWIRGCIRGGVQVSPTITSVSEMGRKAAPTATSAIENVLIVNGCSIYELHGFR